MVHIDSKKRTLNSLEELKVVKNTINSVIKLTEANPFKKPKVFWKKFDFIIFCHFNKLY